MLPALEYTTTEDGAAVEICSHHPDADDAADDSCQTIDDFEYDDAQFVTGFSIDSMPVGTLTIAPQGQVNWTELSATILAGTTSPDGGMALAVGLASNLDTVRSIDAGGISYWDESRTEHSMGCAAPEQLDRYQRTRITCTVDAEPGGWLRLPLHDDAADETTWHWIAVDR